MADTVNVYDASGRSGFISGLGNQVLPASVPAFDFSALDKALATEKEIADKGLETILANLENYAKVQDELSGIEMVNPAAQSQRLDAAKKAVGLDNNAFQSALANMENPAAIYELDRKMKKLSQRQEVKQILYENAVAEAFRTQISSIEDPYLRAEAIKDYTDAINDQTGQKLKQLSIKDYASIDLESDYLKLLDQIAPLGQEDRWVTAEDGTQYLETVILDRDPAAVAKAREYWRKKAGVNANLRARGVIDENGDEVVGEDGTGSWFSSVEASPRTNKISNIKTVYTTKSKTGATGLGSYQPMTAKISIDNGNIQDLDIGAIAAVETSGRHPSVLVHGDASGTGGINVGAFSFNSGNAKAYISKLKQYIYQYHEDHPEADMNEAIAIAERLDNYDYTDASKSNLDNVKTDYGRLDQIMNGLENGYLSGIETSHAVYNFVRPAVELFQAETQDMTMPEISKGVMLMLGDAGINHGQYDVPIKKAIKAIAKRLDNNEAITPESVIDEIEKARISYVKSIPESKLSTDIKKVVINRIGQIADAARRMDKSGINTGPTQSQTQPISQAITDAQKNAAAAATSASEL